jgi:hypothetical protein
MLRRPGGPGSHVRPSCGDQADRDRQQGRNAQRATNPHARRLVIEADSVVAGLDCDRTERRVGGSDWLVMAIHLGAPAWIEGVEKHELASGPRLYVEPDLGVAPRHDPRRRGWWGLG